MWERREEGLPWLAHEFPMSTMTSLLLQVSALLRTGEWSTSYDTPSVSVGDWLLDSCTFPARAIHASDIKWSHICPMIPCMPFWVLSIIRYTDFFYIVSLGERQEEDFLHCIFWGKTRRKVFPLNTDAVWTFSLLMDNEGWLYSKSMDTLWWPYVVWRLVIL